MSSRYAEEVTQEALLGAWRSIVTGRYRPIANTPRALWLWARAIAHRSATNERRRAHHRREHLQPPEEIALERDTAPTPLDLLISMEAIEQIAGACAELSPALRSAAYALATGATLTEYAADAGLTISGASRRAERARAELRARLARADVADRQIATARR